jgi:DNA gyrase inhibitor GyrI
MSIVSILYLTGCSVFGVRNEETPKYEVLVKNENMEIRQYASYIVATTHVDGSFKDTQNKAFRILAGYIFGANEKDSKISMTAPVVMNPQKTDSEKIAMTAPVTQSPKGDGWEMSFMMPSKYKSIEELPKPKDSRVSFKVVESRPMAVITFTGFWNEEKNKKMAEELKTWVSQQGQYEPSSEPKFAGYDPPWTLPFFRRNEMMFELKKR